MYLYTCKIITNTPTAKHAKLHFEKRQEENPFWEIYLPAIGNKQLDDFFFQHIQNGNKQVSDKNYIMHLYILQDFKTEMTYFALITIIKIVDLTKRNLTVPLLTTNRVHI